MTRYGVTSLLVVLFLCAPSAHARADSSAAQAEVQKEHRRVDGTVLLSAGGALMVAGGLSLAFPCWMASPGDCAPWSYTTGILLGGALTAGGFLVGLAGWSLLELGPVGPAIVFGLAGATLAGFALYHGEPALAGVGFGVLAIGAAMIAQRLLSRRRRPAEVVVTPLLWPGGGGVGLTYVPG
ncbi:MAG: hypothetical protein P1V51_00845 [Deltaproteobacteria bacterium]|nr:hypothetical protein [Deltaproteobacteria bacterium]